MNKLAIKIIIFTLFCFWPLVRPVIATQISAEHEVLQDIESQLQNQQKKIERLNEGIEGHKSRVRETRKKEVSLLSELDKLDRRLRDERHKLAGLKGDLVKQEKLIKEKTKELGQAFIEKETVKSHVQKRLNAYYRMGPIV